MASPGSYYLIGIDFGTTYSGAAWAWSERPEQLKVVNQWDGRQFTSSKVPSQILYINGQTKWGFDIPADQKPLQWFKLLMLRPEDMKHPLMDDKIRDSTYIKEAREMLAQLNKTAEDVVADYLRLLWQHVVRDMKRSRGEATVDSIPFRVVITFPAVWPLYAQSRLKQAATIAGIKAPRSCSETKLDLCPEPEAAALAVMDDYDGHPVDSGDIFIICDVGGGTADLITYQIEDTTQWTMAECAPGTGKLCGAIFVDEAFDKKMADWMTPSKWRRLPDATKREWKDDYWELRLKRSFDGEGDEFPVTVPLQLRVNEGIRFSSLFHRSERRARPKIRNHQLQLQRNHVASIFDVSIKPIAALVQDQIQKTRQNKAMVPKAVLLVGGFGQSPYLYNRLQEETRSLGVEVICSTDDRAWTAVCRGALLRAGILHSNEGGGIMRGVVSRVVRFSYGIEIIERFNPEIHSEEDKKFIPSLGTECAVNQMHWYITANETVGDQHVINLDWSKKIRTPLRGGQFQVILLKCDRPDPPRRKNADVRVEGVIPCRISTPFDELPSFINQQGEEWKSVDFQVEMKPQGPMLEFAVIYRGRRQPPLQINPPFTAAAGVSPPLPVPLPSRIPPPPPYRNPTPPPHPRPFSTPPVLRQ